MHEILSCHAEACECLTHRVWRARAAQTRRLQEENAGLRERMGELEGANRALATEAQTWRMRYEALSGHLSAQQQHLQAAHAAAAAPSPAPVPAAAAPSPPQSPYFSPTPQRRVRRCCTSLLCYLPALGGHVPAVLF